MKYEVRKPFASLVTAALLLSLAAAGHAAKKPTKDKGAKPNACMQSCEKTKAESLEKCKSLLGKPNTSCKKRAEAKFKKCGEACAK